MASSSRLRVAAAGIVEVRQVELVDVLGLHQIAAAPGSSAALSWVRVKRRPTLMPASRHRRMPRQRGVEGACLAAEAVVGLADAVEADADVVVADIARCGRCCLRRSRCRWWTARRRSPSPWRAREISKMSGRSSGSPPERISTGTPKRFEVVHHGEDFAGDQLAGEIRVGGDRIAVLAGQVAAPDQVPDHHRARRPARRRSGVGAAISACCCMNWLRCGTWQPPSQPQAGLLQDARAVEHVVGALPSRRAVPAISLTCASTSARLRPCTMANRL